MPNREGGYGGYQSSQPQQNRMPRKVLKNQTYLFSTHYHQKIF